MNKRKLGVLLLAVALIAAIAVGSTLAYFTDSDENANVVTMGHVDITLTEASEDDKATSVIPEEGITFEDVLPGDRLSKIPTVTVADGSADCYIRVKLEAVTGEDSTITAENMVLLMEGLIAEITEDGAWAYNEAEDMLYCTESKAAGDAVDVFQTVKIPGAWKNNVAGQTFSLTIKAEAIQASYITYDEINVCWADEDGVSLTGENAVEIQEYIASID